MGNGYLVFFETSGNQAYVYATNKLRENIGASELTYRAGTQWVLEAAGLHDVPTGNPAEFREWLANKPVSDGVEVILCTSGKALLRVSDEPAAVTIVKAVTSRAAREAPGLSITGAIVPLEGRDKQSVAKAMKAAHERFNNNRDLMPTPSQRFAMLPFCEPCATTGLPASGRQHQDCLSSVSLQKRDMQKAWFSRIANVFTSRNSQMCIASSAEQLEKEFGGFSWLGVVFADGNGLGQIMLNFTEWLGDQDYLDTLRAFSLALDTATEEAFFAACEKLEQLNAAQRMESGMKRLPIVPLLLGGDDLTVLVDGRFALPFTEAFLEAFENCSAKQTAIKEIAQSALGVGRLSAGAGVAIVKSHFPFHSAHALAESLLKSAKIVKNKVQQNDKQQPFPCSALDFHILFDAAFSSLDDIRKERRMAATEKTEYRLWGGPYVVTPSDDLQTASAAGLSWADEHTLASLKSRVELLNAREVDDRLKLPGTQMHALLEALPQGKQVADARLAELRWLYGSGLKDLREEGDSLFRKDDDHHSTRFLDALTSAEFWGIVPESVKPSRSNDYREDAA